MATTTTIIIPQAGQSLNLFISAFIDSCLLPQGSKVVGHRDGLGRALQAELRAPGTGFEAGAWGGVFPRLPHQGAFPPQPKSPARPNQPYCQSHRMPGLDGSRVRPQMRKLRLTRPLFHFTTPPWRSPTQPCVLGTEHRCQLGKGGEQGKKDSLHLVEFRDRAQGGGAAPESSPCPELIVPIPPFHSRWSCPHDPKGQGARAVSLSPPKRPNLHVVFLLGHKNLPNYLGCS